MLDEAMTSRRFGKTNTSYASPGAWRGGGGTSAEANGRRASWVRPANSEVLVVRVIHDEEAGVLVGVSDDIPGLVVQGHDLADVEHHVRAVAPMLLVANGKIATEAEALGKVVHLTLSAALGA